MYLIFFQDVHQLLCHTILGFESHHLKTKTKKLKIRQCKVVLALKGPSIISESVTYDSFCHIGSHKRYYCDVESDRTSIRYQNFCKGWTYRDLRLNFFETTEFSTTCLGTIGSGTHKPSGVVNLSVTMIHE